MIKSEWLKLRTVTGNQVMMIMALAAGIGFAILLPSVIPKDQLDNPTPNDLYGLATAGLGIAQVLVGVVAIQIITQEFRYTLRLTFAAEPRRPKVMGAKTIVVIAVALVSAAIVMTVSLSAGGAILRARDIGFDTGWDGFWRASIGAVIATAIFAVYGLALGGILKSPAAAISVFVVWGLVAEPILYGLLPKVGQFAPFQAAQQLQMLDPSNPGLGPLWGGLLAAGYAIVALLVATWLVTKRDA
jgi:ABC-2 type transport system permease protein